MDPWLPNLDGKSRKPGSGANIDDARATRWSGSPKLTKKILGNEQRLAKMTSYDPFQIDYRGKVYTPVPTQ
jgi:hypothetical protein